jgi:hypothetical protein
MVNPVDKDVYMTIITWVSGKLFYPVPPPCIRHFATDFLQRCLSAPEGSVDAAIHSASPTPLLREWAKSKLTNGSWRDALAATLNVNISCCYGARRWLDIPLVWSLQPRDTRFIGLSVTISK